MRAAVMSLFQATYFPYLLIYLRGYKKKKKVLSDYREKMNV